MKLRLCGLLVLATLLGAVATVSGEAAAGDGSGIRAFTLGSSVQGRSITAVEVGDLDSPNRTLVVGSIHGNESAGMAIANRLLHGPTPVEVDLWIIPTLNPDGVAANSRGNSHGVDLNRNFPWRWRPLHGLYDSGSHALSEPESRIGYAFISRVRPTVSVWFHQHLDVVDESGGSLAVERHYARRVHLPLARLPREPGSVVGWENHRLRGATAFVVELPPGTLTAKQTNRFAQAVIDTSRIRDDACPGR